MIKKHLFAHAIGMYNKSGEFFQFSAIIFTNNKLFAPKLENAPT
jgi:hypothetical protein